MAMVNIENFIKNKQIKVIYKKKITSIYNIYTGPMRGGSVGTSIRGPENQEGNCESLGQLNKYNLAALTYYACLCFV
jgi:hypothetical protein